MIELSWLVFILLGVDATLGDGSGISEHLHSFREVNVSRIIPRLVYIDGYIKPKSSPH